MSVPTVGECYTQLGYHLVMAQEKAAMLAHLFNAEGRTQMGIMWLGVAENFKKTQYQLSKLIEGRLQ
jgi:hypothetical protein